MPQATSTFSMARCNSPFDSARVLPHSRVMVRARIGEVALHQRLEAEQLLHALAGRRATPVGESPGGRPGGAVDLIGVRIWRSGDHLGSRRVDYVRECTGARAPPVTADIICYFLQFHNISPTQSRCVMRVVRAACHAAPGTHLRGSLLLQTVRFRRSLSNDSDTMATRGEQSPPVWA